MTTINRTNCAASASGSETLVVAAMTTAVSMPPGVIARYAVNGSDLPATVYDRYALRPGTTIRGPGAFEERESTFIVGPECTVMVDDHFNLIADMTFETRG